MRAFKIPPSPLTTALVNPTNVHPETNNATNSSASYFTDKSVLDNIPVTMLYLSAIYAVIFLFGLLVIVEAPYAKKMEGKEKPKLMMRLKSAWTYMYKVACKDYNFYLLWMGRYLYLTIGAGVMSHWKTYSFTQSRNDQIIATAGGLRYKIKTLNGHIISHHFSGVVNCLSRLLAGYMVDKFVYKKLMTTCGVLLTLNLLSMYFAGQYIVGILVCVWLVYFIGFTHFSTIPAQVSDKSIHIHIILPFKTSISFRFTDYSLVTKFMWYLDALVWLNPSPTELSEYLIQ